MAPAWRLDLDELDDEGGLPERRAGGPPERLNSRSANRRVQKRARRSRSNEIAKRGMHQRRNKRVSW